MNVKITTEVAANRPTPDPLASSVMDHATVVDKDDFGLRNNEGLWPSYNCMDTLVPTPICPDPEFTKTFGFAEWVPGFEFAVHGGAQCSAVGLDQNDMRSEISRVFDANEGKGIEMMLLFNRFVATTSDEFPAWSAPVDVSAPSSVVGKVSLEVALAMLEGYAAANYAGIPTIHMPRAAASLLSMHIVWKDGKAYTRNGSKVAMGGGYDLSETDGTWDLYATGEVYVERGPKVNVATFTLPGDGSTHDPNTVLALTERMYRVAVDCFVAKATAKVW